MQIWNSASTILKLLTGIKVTEELVSVWQRRRLQGLQEQEWTLNMRESPPPDGLPTFLVALPQHESMKKKLNCSIPGVYAHWTISHAGKFTTALYLAHRVWQDGRGIRFIDCALTSIHPDMSAENWFRNALQIPLNQVPIAKYLSPGGARPFEYGRAIENTLIFDHFDLAMKLQDMESFLDQLAHIAASGYWFNVMLCIRCEKLAQRVIGLNGGKKFQLLGGKAELSMWADDSIDSLVENIAAKFGIDDDAKARLKQLGMVAHSPYPIIESLGNGFTDLDSPHLDQVAEYSAQEWGKAGSVKRVDMITVNGP
jgi:hypothetical protein